MNYAVILASGSGNRIGGDIPKQFIEINRKTILEYTLEKFNNNENTDRIILVTSPKYIDLCKKFKFEKLYKITEGGIRRQDSSRLGVNLIEENDAKVLIHDAARPYVTNEIINNCYLALDKYNAIDTAIRPSDTVVQTDDEGKIIKILDRNSLINCQTPQGFRADLIKKAHNMALMKKMEVTDDVSLIVNLKIDKVYVVEGSVENIKITYKKDLDDAKRRLGRNFA